MNKLPAAVKIQIREYASDKLQPSPTAKLIKQLSIAYQPSRLVPSCKLFALVVRANHPQRFTDKLYLDDLENSGCNEHERYYYLSDFLPSYWSSDYWNHRTGSPYDDETYHDRLRMMETDLQARVAG